MGNNSALMLSIWVKKKERKKVPLLFKVIFSFYFPAMSEIEMYHPWSLLDRQDWSTDTCKMAKVSPRQGAECVFSRKRKKEKKPTVMEPWMVNGSPAGCHGWCMAIITSHGPTALSIVWTKWAIMSPSQERWNCHLPPMSHPGLNIMSASDLGFVCLHIV